jgi:RNA-directed DNA polymerase
MTTAKTVGAVSSEAAEWYAINWQTIHQNVRRLQVRIVQATKAGRWNKVKSLQRLLTHSYSGKVLAVRRVTENTGKKTPGVDQIIWKTPEDKGTRAQYSANGIFAVSATRWLSDGAVSFSLPFLFLAKVFQ